MIKSVIFVTGSLADGGAEKVMSILASGCAELGADVTLVVLRPKKIVYPVSDKVKIVQFTDEGKLATIKRIKKLHRVMKESAAEVVIPFLPIISLYTLIANIGLRKKVIMSERADPRAQFNNLPWKDKIGNFFMRKCGLYSLADWMVFQTQDAQSYYSEKIQRKSSIIPNPLDTAKLPERYAGEREKRIVAAGRFSEEKNFALLIDGFTRLMNDVRQKKIKCIVVKDLSRFGRNYLEAGYYIETVFPFLGIRLIAVTDNFDSTRKEDMESLALPIRNMVNAMYAKDISKKIWTSLQRKKEAGYAVGNDAPYGYIRNPVTKRNEIDPEAAFYVQLIFQWELMGVPIFEIARRMTLLQVPTPREWHRKMVEGKEVLTCKKWGVTTIRHILENQTYVGDTINNKSTQKLFAGQDKRDLPKEQWYVAKNTHPAIIARDDFEKVQKILDKNRAVFHTVRAKSEQIRTEYQNDLAGMVFCADCGRPMEFERLPHGAEESKKVCYYICKARQADDKCIGHQITEKLLKALIMDQLHLFITQLSDRRKVVEELRKIEDVQNPVYRAKGEIMSLTDKVSQMAKKREQLYADYVAGVVDSEDYQLIREDYSRQYDGLRAALQEAENKKVQVEQQIEEYLNMTSHLEEHLDNFEFDIQLVKSLVQKIEVSADKRIRIVFGFRDVFTELGKESAET